ncbi:MAG: cytochrome c3 family protein [Phycisphaerae bacterium]|nr:cytochrome c3 family protein [Phycisphaerae bacterium]
MAPEALGGNGPFGAAESGARGSCLRLAATMAILLTATATTLAQDKTQVDAVPVETSVAEPEEHATNCGNCHYCETPKHSAPCLRNPCTRHLVPTAELAAVSDVIVLGVLENTYLPVPFDHRGHAEKAEMGDGCATCHHHSSAGQPPPPCRACHDPAASGTSVDLPGLRGAYHQQCLACHREWSDERACELCHRRKAGSRVAAAPGPGEILGRMHPPIPSPAGEFYEGSANREASGRVLFRHGEHADRFGLRCVDCHRESSCARCHSRSDEARRNSTLVEHHAPCVRCHRDDMSLAGRSAGRCEKCHIPDGTPLRGLFDHATVAGWPLKSYHAGVPCRSCHADVPFEAPSKECSACHEPWDAGAFDHAITGQVLDENHAEIDCSTCHQDGRYDRPPVCTDCHEGEMRFPNGADGASAR